MRLALASLIAAAVVAAATLGSGTSSADTNDDNFIAALHTAGIVSDSGDVSMIQVGHDVCTLEASGTSSDDVIAAVEAGNPGLTPFDAGFVVGSAEVNYCPNESA